MSELATLPQQDNGEIQRIAQPVRAIRVVEDEGPLAYLFDTARFEHMQRIARMMANATLTPKHLQGQNPEQTLANCFRVCNQAIRWGFDPFAVCDETYVVHGKLGYQGKLIAAVVNTRAGLRGRLKYSFDGQGDGRTVTVTGTFQGEDQPRAITLSVGQAKTANEIWKKDPDQKLIYSGVTKWARAHCPEVIMGILTEDDLERIAQADPPPQNLRGIINELPAAQAPAPVAQVEAKAKDAPKRVQSPPVATAGIATPSPAERTGQSQSQTVPQAATDSPAAADSAGGAADAPDLSDWAVFCKLCADAAQANNYDADAFNDAIKTLIVKSDIKAGQRKKWEPARRMVLQAFKDNRVTADGTIKAVE